MPVRPAITPTLVYDDAPAAIDFLCDVFGFTRHAVYPGATEGTIAHAQLMLNGCMIMLGSASNDSRVRFGTVSPRSTDGLLTGGIHVTLDDPDAHHARAVAAGATIVTAPDSPEYGGRGYSARDSEGYIWSFGSYDAYAHD